MNIRNLVLQQYSDVIMKRFEVPENGSGKAIKVSDCLRFSIF